jgi:hypothetical protein
MTRDEEARALRVLNAVTDNGGLTAKHFRCWATDLEREKGYTPMLAEWLRGVADALLPSAEYAAPRPAAGGPR